MYTLLHRGGTLRIMLKKPKIKLTGNTLRPIRETLLKSGKSDRAFTPKTRTLL